MTRPKAYDPAHGYRFQILWRDCRYSREFDHCDYATDRKELNYLLGEYRLAFGCGEFKVCSIPRKYCKAQTV